METKQSLFDRLCSRAGFEDLKPDDRSGDKPLQRQAVWCIMREQGIKFREIAEQSHRTLGTVAVGIQHFKDLLSVNDAKAVQIYNKLNE
jgi:hypothetical protein